MPAGLRRLRSMLQVSFEGETHEVLRPDRLTLARFNHSSRIRHLLDERPQCEIELAAQADRDRPCFVERETLETGASEQLAQRLRRKDREVRQIAVDDLARKQSSAVGG